MSTIQKAFVFIVVVLAVLTAAATLVLFAQRQNWRATATATEENLKKANDKYDKMEKQLADEKDALKAKVTEYEIQNGVLITDLESARRDLELVKDDKARQEALAAELTANYRVLADKMDVLGTRTQELELAKEAAEKALDVARSTAMAAEEALAISERKAKDLDAQVKGLAEQLAAGEEQVEALRQKVAVLETYTGPIGPTPTAATRKPVYGRVTGLSNDGAIAFVSVGSDDGVQKGMMFLIFKTQGSFVAKAKVYDVSPDKSAAKIIKPVYGTIVEGDNVTNE